MCYRFVGLALIGSLTAIRPGAAQTGPIANIKDIRRTVLVDAVRVTIELDHEVPFHEERIPDPSRVFVDLPGTKPVASLNDQTIRFELDGDIVRQIRLGRHPNNTTRVVLDATDVSSYSVYPLYGPFRIVIDCVRASHDATAVPVPVPVKIVPLRPLAARSTAPASNRRLPGRSPGARVLLTSAYATLVRETDVEPPLTIADATIVATTPPVTTTSAPPAVPTAAPERNAKGGFSMSRQLGLGVSRIVIDPGHGGHDPGASGKGVAESELVLDVALRLEKLLQKAQGVEVILTRRTNEFIPLQERTAIANREGADLFLSIHANASSNPQARGIETYFLNFANNQSAAAVAARENATSGQAMGALPDLVKAITLNNKLDESRDFATHIQRNMFDRLRGTNATLKDLGVKQAPFVVLIGASMPSVLAEISFVTNPQEARLLKGSAYRQRIAEALFSAIRKYQGSLKSGAAVASQ